MARKTLAFPAKEAEEPARTSTDSHKLLDFLSEGYMVD